MIGLPLILLAITAVLAAIVIFVMYRKKKAVGTAEMVTDCPTEMSTQAVYHESRAELEVGNIRKMDESDASAREAGIEPEEFQQTQYEAPQDDSKSGTDGGGNESELEGVAVYHESGAELEVVSGGKLDRSDAGATGAGIESEELQQTQYENQQGDNELGTDGGGVEPKLEGVEK